MLAVSLCRLSSISTKHFEVSRNMRKTTLLALVTMLTLVGGSASAQTSCPAGSYHSGSQCRPCAAGKYCPAGTTTATITSCPLGKYCPAGAAPLECSAGTFNSTVRASAAGACRPCAPGTFSAAGAAGCTVCQSSVGEWSTAGSSACTQVDCALTPGYQGKGSMCSCKPYFGPGPVTFAGGIPRGCSPMSCNVGPFDAGSITGQPGQCACSPGYTGRPVSDGKQLIGGCKARRGEGWASQALRATPGSPKAHTTCVSDGGSRAAPRVKWQTQVDLCLTTWIVA